MVKPVVLIATHKRWDITCLNIDSLLAQSVTPEIILVVSEATEYVRFTNKYPLVNVVAADNDPIGKKWQDGVDPHDPLPGQRGRTAKAIGANPLIITGSDDILGPGFIENACRLVEEGNHFVGLQWWWMHHRGIAYLCEYKAKLPLGGGRIYSGKMLESLDYKLFDTSKDRHLDDYAWNRVRLSNLKTKCIDGVEEEGLSIHAIKGKWEMINKFDLNHKNIKVLKQTGSTYVRHLRGMV